MNQSYRLLETHEPFGHACCINTQLATGLRAECAAASVAGCISLVCDVWLAFVQLRRDRMLGEHVSSVYEPAEDYTSQAHL